MFQAVQINRYKGGLLLEESPLTNCTKYVDTEVFPRTQNRQSGNFYFLSSLIWLRDVVYQDRKIKRISNMVYWRKPLHVLGHRNSRIIPSWKKLKSRTRLSSRVYLRFFVRRDGDRLQNIAVQGRAGGICCCVQRIAHKHMTTT